MSQRVQRAFLPVAYLQLDQGGAGTRLLIGFELHRADAAFTVAGHADVLDDLGNMGVIADLLRLGATESQK